MQSSSVTTTKPSVGQKDNWHKVEDEKGRSTGYILLDQITYGVNSNGNANRNLINSVQAMILSEERIKQSGHADAAYGMVNVQYNVSQRTAKVIDIWLASKDGEVLSQKRQPSREEYLPLDYGTQGAEIFNYICKYCKENDELIVNRTNAQPKSQSASPTTMRQQSDAPAAQPQQQTTRNTPPNLTLANVSLEDSFATVQQVLGTPYKEGTTNSGLRKYSYPSVEVFVRDGRVAGLVSETPAAAMPNGLHEGSSLQEVLSRYGNDYTKSNYDGLDLYEYNFTTPSGRSAILRFAVNSSGRVDYISIR